MTGAGVGLTARPTHYRARVILLACLAGHLLAATLILMHVAPLMAEATAQSAVPGHMAAMQAGLTRFLYTLVLLPPTVAIEAALLVWYSVRKQARTAEFRFWTALAFAPFVVEELGRAAVVLAGSGGTPGELLTQATTFTAGPAVIFDLLGITLGASAAYWAGVLSFTAALAVYCWARAIAAAQTYSANPSVIRRQRRTTGLDMGLAIMAATMAYLLAAVANFLAVPVIAPMFLSTFG